jgi:hypothetical protein
VGAALPHGFRLLGFPQGVDSTFFSFVMIFIIMTTNDKGNIGLAKAIGDITVKGYQVFLPLTDTSILDVVIASKDLTIKKLQVKYVKLNHNGSMKIPLESVVNGKRVLNDFSKVDGFAVYCPDNDTMYYVPVAIINAKSITVKILENKQGRKVLRSGDEFLELNKLFVEN